MNKPLKKFTTISIKTEILEELSELNLNFHGIEMTQNTDKIRALILLYKETLSSKNK
ncbi:MAG: hypothetical protein Q9M94_05510 [Candidatus Gracilibacteria bacterium]|nr:hypothetical protein [Candidatus Gracilibacteria bacterium]